jgi:hypothetical protein
MKTNFLKRSVLAIAIMFFAVSYGFSQNQPQRPNQDELSIMSVIPDLTPEQKDKITKMEDEMKKKSVPLRAQLDVKEAELDQLMVTNSELKTKETKLKELSDIRFQLHYLNIEFHSNVRALLNDTQKVELDNWYLKRQDKKDGNHENGKKHQGKHNGHQNH